MADTSSRAPMAGGFFIAAGTLIGAILGAHYGQSSLGFVLGCGIGVAIAVAVWALDRVRKG